METAQVITFADRAAIVTGAGGGMGREHALLLARRGAKTIVNDVNSDAANAVVAEIAAAGGVAVAVVQDVSTWEGAVALVSATLELFGSVDILVSNAAIINMTAMADMTPENFDKLMRVNAHGPFYLALAAWPYMVKQRYGRMVLVTSGAATVGEPLLAHYSAAKGAVMGMVRTLSLEGKADNIHVNGLLPVAFTGMSAGTDYDEGERLSKLLPSRLVSPAVAWLCHEDCSINGELWQAGAGRVAREFIGATKGFYDPELSVELVRDHEAEIEDRDGYVVPTRASEVFDWIMANTIGRSTLHG